jgi:hypothetical protein
MALTATLTARWPTVVGLILAAGGITGVVLMDTEGRLDQFAPAVALMSGIYLTAYALGRPAAAWIAFPVLSALMVPLTLLDLNAGIAMTVVSVVLWLWAVLRGRSADQPWFGIQTAGMVAFGALTLLALLAGSRLGVLLAGLGWFAHGVWDAYHFKIGRVVDRSWSEACLVVDIPIGLALVIASFAS